VSRGNGALGLGGDLDLHELAVGVGRRPKEVHGLAGDGILERVAGADRCGLDGHVSGSCFGSGVVSEP
jgi:hypothetical protein